MDASANVPRGDFLPQVLAVYGVNASDESEQSRFITQHIDDLSQSDNETIARTGQVLMKAKEGFGLGYKVPLGLMAMGQAMLGIDLAVAAPFIASNPAAMTAATLGAVYYGYQSLDDRERTELHAKIAEALDFGVELVRNIAEFCVATMKSLLDKENLIKIRAYLTEAAEAVGTSLYEITGSLYDRMAGAAVGASNAAYAVGGSISSTAASAYERGRSYLGGSREESD